MKKITCLILLSIFTTINAHANLKAVGPELYLMAKLQNQTSDLLGMNNFSYDNQAILNIYLSNIPQNGSGQIIFQLMKGKSATAIYYSDPFKTMPACTFQMQVTDSQVNFNVADLPNTAIHCQTTGNPNSTDFTIIFSEKTR